MPARNVNSPDALESSVCAREPPTQRDEQQHEAKLAALRVAIDEGDASGVARKGVFARVRKALGVSESPQ